MLLCLNILFYMFVSFVPFATSVVNAFPQTQVAPEFFGANIALIGWVLWLQWKYACSQPGMLAPHVSAEYRELVRGRFFWIPVVLTFTALVCYWSVEISLAVYVLLLPLYLIPGRIEGRQATAGSESPAAARYEDTRAADLHRWREGIVAP